MRTRTLASVVAVAALAPLTLAAVASATTEPPSDTAVDTSGPDGTAAVDSTEPAATTVVATTEPATTVVATTEPATTAAATTAPPADLGELTVGSADFPESQLLAEIYGQTLQSIGYDVSFEHAIGSREVYFGAVESGEVDLVPEYTGSLLAFLTAPEQPTATTVEEQVAAIGEALPEGLEVLDPSTAEDKDVIVCTQAAVDEHGLTDLSSLFAVAGEITIGGPPEMEERSPFGIAGFRELYGAEFAEFVPLAVGDIPAALGSGSIDCGNLFSTDPVISTGGLVAMEDDLVIIPHEAVLPLVRSEVVTPELVAALDCANAELDTETLIELNTRVIVDQLGPDVVAGEWLATIDCPPAGPAPASTAPAGTEPATTEAAGTTPASTAPATTEAAGTAPATTWPAGTTPGTEPPTGTEAPPTGTEAPPTGTEAPPTGTEAPTGTGA